jgi:Major Facilitator Superfamily
MTRPVASNAVTAAAVRHGGRSAGLAILCTLLFLTFLDNTIVSVALGSIQADLHAGVSALQWVVGAYALTFASAMLACRMIGDQFGRKKAMLAGAGVFCARSVLCALAPSTGQLMTGRAGGDGARCSRQRAGHAVDAAPLVSRGAEPIAGDRGVGSGIRARARGRSCPRPRAGRPEDLARDLLVQPGLRPGGAGRRRGHPARECRPGGPSGGHRRGVARRGRTSSAAATGRPGPAAPASGCRSIAQMLDRMAFLRAGRRGVPASGTLTLLRLRSRVRRGPVCMAGGHAHYRLAGIWSRQPASSGPALPSSPRG